ncbi:MAG: OmpA family protein [Pirellulales bacterium]|nr:OmpA family protein [Pirellulales bacterium]
MAVLACGCAQNPLLLQSQLQNLQQQQAALAKRTDELLSRATSLDTDNQELQSLLAQAAQQRRVLEDQVAVLQDQLRSATAQIARLREGQGEGQAGVPANLASQRQQRVGELPLVQIPGAVVRRDGDVIRIELAGSRLFERGGARLLPEAGPLLEQVADVLVQNYPRQIIGIEGHTDSDPVQSGRWASNHQLSVGRAMAVYDYLAARTRLSPRRLFVAGHCPNHPVVSNGTPQGKERNRRVELVVYPEQVME